jgi:lysophospholipase L1-like esterase
VITKVPVRQLTRRRKFAYTAVCLTFALFLTEVAVRVRAWTRYGTTSPIASDSVFIRDKSLGLKVHRPGFELRGTEIHIKINSLGFRGEEFSKEKPRGTVRIACVGASTTYCAEVSHNEATWPAVLQTLLQPEYPEVKLHVINAGVSGYLIADSIKNLRYRVLPLEPDLVIYYEAHNDLLVDTRNLAINRGIIVDDTQPRSNLVAYMTEKSLLFHLIDKNIALVRAKRGSGGEKLTDLPRNLPDRVIHELAVIHDLVSEADIPLVLSHFFIRPDRDQPRATQVKNAEVAFLYMPWMTIDSLLDSFDLYNEAIARFADSRDIPYVDDRIGIPSDGVHYVDHVHFSNSGCKVMAQRFARYILDQKLLVPIVAKATASRPEAR